jgi:glycosyltransferase involved in cell wall biosynthesis
VGVLTRGTSAGKVIVWTNAYNADQVIARAMDSILNQTYQDWIYLVLDNGSTDDTGYIIRDYAMRDPRIIALDRDHNEVKCSSYGKAIWSTTSAKWWCHLDADDEYDPTFLEKMVAFASENRLDIAASGYEKLDGRTGELVSRRTANENYILEGSGFPEKFVQYRGFTTYIWAKLTSIEFLVRTMKQMVERDCWDHFAFDSYYMLSLFGQAERAGIFGESLYKYYQYPKSYDAAGIEACLNSMKQLYVATKDYALKFRNLSKEHEDFLQAILLSIMDENVQTIKESNVGLGRKLSYLLRVFTDPDVQAMFRYQAGPEWRNLAAREDDKRKIIDWIEAQDSIDHYKSIVECIKHSLATDAS